MKTIDLKCAICDCIFSKELREYNRRIKLGKSEFYCSLNCSGKREDNIYRFKEVSKPYRFKGGENKITTERGNLLRSMKEFSRRIRRRKHFEFEIDAEILLNIWEKQNGICPYTKVKLVLPFTPEYDSVNKNYKASIDRIDSAKPYSVENVQFVSISLNHLKSDMSENELFEFFELIKKDLVV
jgi:hypothetical protein